MKLNNKYQNNLIIIAGPTGIGKSNLSINLAKKLRTDIIGADSRQLYQEMSIGTAKPHPQELAEVKHWMVDSHSIHQDFTTSQYEDEVMSIIEKTFINNNCIIMTGGTGMYIKAVTEGLDLLPPPDLALRENLEQGYVTNGLPYLQEVLCSLAPDVYQTIDKQNSRRLIRAIEIAKTSSNYNQVIQKKLRTFNTIPICLTMDRDALYKRINTRVDQMIEDGLEAEARALWPYKHLKSLNTVGYQEMFNYFEGLTSLSDAIELIKRNSRRYAKRQMTWFRNQGKWEYFDVNQGEKILAYIVQQIADQDIKNDLNRNKHP